MVCIVCAMFGRIGHMMNLKNVLASTGIKFIVVCATVASDISKRKARSRFSRARRSLASTIITVSPKDTALVGYFVPSCTSYTTSKSMMRLGKPV